MHPAKQSNEVKSLNHIVHQVTYNIDGTVLPFVEKVRDLDVYLHSRLKYDQHISLIVHNVYKLAVLILKSMTKSHTHIMM